MWQYQKLSMFLALGMVAIASSTGCATSVEDPVLDEEAMAADDTAESSEALTAGGDWGGGFVGYGPGYYGGYGDWGGYAGYGDWGGYAGYGDWGGYGGFVPPQNQNVAVIINQNNGYAGYGDWGGYAGYGDWGGYGGYGDWGGYGGYGYGGYDGCGGGAFFGDDWF